MSLLTKLERPLGRFALPHVTAAIIAGQVAIYALAYFRPQPGAPPLAPEPNIEMLLKLMLIPRAVLGGEVWRLVTFVFVPPITNLIWAFFFWYLFYLMGSALETTWGAFRYNVYLLLGYVATVAASFIVPDQPATGGFVQASVFLAFAHLYPDFELCLCFIFPVKIKWLARMALSAC